MEQLILSPTDFVALVNQTLEYAYPFVTIAGELSNFKVSRSKWAYFDLKDETSSVKFFGSVYNLPGPLEDGMTVEASGRPQLSPKYGFSVTFQSIKPVGEGTIKRAADLLYLKLEKEGLLDPARKRALPYPPRHIGLITSKESAAFADFNKILNARFGGLKISFADSMVQGESAAQDIISALDTINQLADPPELIVITRGGGSTEDLAIFNNEILVRSIALSRLPVLVAVGHETDITLAELAADLRCSTPTHAAQTLVPDRLSELKSLKDYKNSLNSNLISFINSRSQEITNQNSILIHLVSRRLSDSERELSHLSRLVKALNPKTPLAKGYTITRLNGKVIKSAKQLKKADKLDIEYKDGSAKATVESVK